MFFCVMTSVNEITMWYDLNDILSVMIGCSATFVAIIGGLIANKAISDTAEKETIDKQLQQIDAELTINRKELEWLYEWVDEYNAKDFVRDNLDALLDKSQLSDVYDTDNSNEMDYDNLLPYWNKALAAVEKFQAVASAEKNNDGVPKPLLDELDNFQYEICSEYHNCIEDRKMSFFDRTISPNISKYRIQHYNENFEKINKLEIECEILDAKEKLLQERQKTISISKDIKGGMKIFTIVSIINIILPIIFMLFNPTSNKMWYYIETSISLFTFSVGIIIMITYIYSLFPKKKTNIKDKRKRRIK